MKRRITPFRLLVLLIVLLLLSSFARLDLAAAIAAPPREALMFFLSPASRPIHAISTLGADKPQTAELAERSQLAEDNRRLMTDVARLEDELRRATQRISELAQLRNNPSLQLKRVELIDDVAVTSWRGGATPVLTINRGSAHGVAAGMVVGLGANLVGRGGHVTATAATVSLINTPGTLLDVRIVPPRADPSRKPIITQCRPVAGSETFHAEGAQGDPVRPGDLALLMLAETVVATQSRWPDEAAGLIVGQVVRVEDHPDDPKLRTRIVIEPLRPLKALTRVVVLSPGE
jgi:cell shape-determining protein MreC